jgi:hypothetical protein
MRTTDLFTNNRSSKRLNETLAKTFGTRLDLESFDTTKLEDARNKLRTQIHTARQASGFNETIENETLTQAQFMHDAIVAELMDREEHIVDTSVQEGADIDKQELMDILKRFDENMNEIGGYGDPDYNKILAALSQGDVESAVEEVFGNYADQDGGEIRSNDFDNYLEDLEDQFKDMVGGSDDDEGGETDDGYALASAGFGSDEDYESINNEGESKYTDVSIAQDVYAENPDLDSEDDILNAAFPHVVKMMGGNKKRANYLFNYDEDFPGEMISAYKWLQRQEHDVGEATGRDAYQRDYDASVSGMGRRERENDEGDTEPANNFAVSINGKQWKVFKGRGYYADDDREKQHYRQLKDWAAKKSESTGKKWEVNVTGAPATESIQRTQGESMSNLREGEVQQASAIVTAKTMVDRVSRWIEELSSMENDTLLQLGDSIRDEMGQEQAKAFISSVAPAIQQALENLKSTRETMATGVRQLTGEEQGAEMLGGDPAAGGDEMGPAEPDAMNMGGDMGDMGGEDEFAAAEPAAGGLGDAGREQRESINRGSSLMKVLAG